MEKSINEQVMIFKTFCKEFNLNEQEFLSLLLKNFLSSFNIDFIKEVDYDTFIDVITNRLDILSAGKVFLDFYETDKEQTKKVLDNLSLEHFYYIISCVSLVLQENEFIETDFFNYIFEISTDVINLNKLDINHTVDYQYNYLIKYNVESYTNEQLNKFLFESKFKNFLLELKCFDITDMPELFNIYYYSKKELNLFKDILKFKIKNEKDEDKLISFYRELEELKKSDKLKNKYSHSYVKEVTDTDVNFLMNLLDELIDFFLNTIPKKLYVTIFI